MQVLDLTRSLEIQIRARVQAENANMDTELRIRDLEAVVSSQRKALESVQVCGAMHLSQSINEWFRSSFAFHLDTSIAISLEPFKCLVGRVS